MSLVPDVDVLCRGGKDAPIPVNTDAQWYGLCGALLKLSAGRRDITISIERIKLIPYTAVSSFSLGRHLTSSFIISLVLHFCLAPYLKLRVDQQVLYQVHLLYYPALW
jgi:hypothetical protein